MNEEVQKHLEAALNEVRAMFLKAAERIEEIKPGEKIPATQLADDLAKEQNETGPQLYPTLKKLLNGYPGVVIRRGAHGGIYRPLPNEMQKALGAAPAPLANQVTDGNDGLQDQNTSDKQ